MYAKHEEAATLRRDRHRWDVVYVHNTVNANFVNDTYTLNNQGFVIWLFEPLSSILTWLSLLLSLSVIIVTDVAIMH